LKGGGKRGHIKLSNEELYGLCSLSHVIWGHQIKENEMGRVYSTHDGNNMSYGVLVGKPGRKRPLPKPVFR